MTDDAPTSRFAAGASAGAAAWLAYGAVETAFVMIAPRVAPSPIDFRYLHIEWAALLLVLYASAGAALGALAAAALPGRTAAAAVAAATVPAAGAASLLVLVGAQLGALPLAFLAVAAGAAGIQVAAARGAWRPWLRFAASPWTVAFLLAGPAWITKDLIRTHHSTGTRAAAAAAFCAAVLLVSAAAHRIARGRTHPFSAPIRAALIAAAVLAAGVAMNRVPPAGGPSAGPPVIVLVMDTVRADHLALQGYGRPNTPRLEELAREAAVFTRATSAGDMTLSSHASLFTGKYAREHGARHLGTSVLADRFDTLAELLREKGYRSYAVIANHGYLSPFFRLNQGFDYWDSRASSGWTSDRYLLRYGVRELVRGTPRSPQENDRPFRSADDIHSEVDALIERLGESLDGAFLFVNYMDAHFPYLPPPPFDTMFPGRDPSFTVPELDRHRREMSLKGGTVPEGERRHLQSQYDGAIAYLDSRMGFLFDRLKEIGAYDDAVLIVTSDHGEAFGERGLIDHGVSAYGDQVFVPLIVKAPGTDARRDDRPASTVDVAPTVLDAAGLAIPDGIRGRSLLRDAEAGRTVVAEHYPSELFTDSDAPSGRLQRALTDGRHKLVRTAGAGEELYDVEKDPLDTTDLAADRPEAAAELAARLDAWLDATEESQGEAAVRDDDADERLKALGYVQ